MVVRNSCSSESIISVGLCPREAQFRHSTLHLTGGVKGSWSLGPPPTDKTWRPGNKMVLDLCGAFSSAGDGRKVKQMSIFRFFCMFAEMETLTDAEVVCSSRGNPLES